MPEYAICGQHLDNWQRDMVAYLYLHEVQTVPEQGNAAGSPVLRGTSPDICVEGNSYFFIRF